MFLIKTETDIILTDVEQCNITLTEKSQFTTCLITLSNLYTPQDMIQKIPATQLIRANVVVLALCSPFGSFTWILNCCQSSTQKTLPRLKLTPRKRSLKYRFGNWHQLCVKSRQLGADTIVFHSIYYKNIGKMAFQPHAILDRIFGHHQRDQKLFLLQKGLGATRQRC